MKLIRKNNHIFCGFCHHEFTLYERGTKYCCNCGLKVEDWTEKELVLHKTFRKCEIAKFEKEVDE